MRTYRKNSINTLVFDVSGVLIDDLPTVWRANRDAYSFYGYKALSMGEFKDKFKIPIVEFHKSNGIPEEMSNAVERKYRERYPIYQHLIRVFPEVRDVLSHLKNRGFKLGISSNIPSKFLWDHLHQFEILTFFDAITGQDDCDEQKPSPKSILTTLSKMGSNPEMSAYIGDMEEDMIAGKRAGVYTIAVDRREAYQPIRRLKIHNPDLIINNLNDLLIIV